MFKTILSVTGIDHGDEDLLVAAELAQQSQAHLNVVVIARVPPPPVADMAGQAYSTYAYVWEDEDARLNARVAELSERLSARGYEADVKPVFCLSGSVGEEIAQRAAYADVTLVGKQLLADASLRKSVLDGALFKSPAPALLLGDGTSTLAPERIILAWNSTLEAGNAARSSMDLLIQAKQVHVVIVDPVATPHAMGEEPGADLATFLARHGVKVTVDVIAGGGLDPAEVLQRHAKDIGADLIVMGAYGHARLRERIFGGTTETMLGNVAMPVLMAR